MAMGEEKVKLQIRHLKKMFNATEGVKDISFDVYAHELLTLLGPSGCGKTTVLRSIGGFNEIDDGSILLDGQEMRSLPPEKRPTCMVFQSYNLWPHMTVMGNMEFSMKLRKVPVQQRREKIAAMLRLVKMEGSENKYPGQLSGGQQQRIAIARALVNEPSVLLMDEPFSALDAKIRAAMREELRRIQKETGLTIIFVTHDQEEAMAISDRIAVMNRGMIEQIGAPAEIYDAPKNLFVAQFIGEMNIVERDGERIGIRPEDLHLEVDGSAAEVVSVMPLGHFVNVSIEDKRSHQRLKAYVPKGGGSDFRAGMDVDYSYGSFVRLPKEDTDLSVIERG